MIKKYLAAALALTMCVCTFTACAKDSDSSSSSKSSSSSSKADSSSASSEVMTPGSDLIDDGETAETPVPDPALVIDGEEQDISNLVVCTIDGYDVDFDMFRYYYYYTLNRYQSSYGATIDTIKETEGGFDLFLEDVVTSLKQEMVALQATNDPPSAIQLVPHGSLQVSSAKRHDAGMRTPFYQYVKFGLHNETDGIVFDMPHPYNNDMESTPYNTRDRLLWRCCMQIEGLDEIDNRILSVIRDNARLSYKDIGEQVGISRVSVKTRMDTMQEKGIIQGYQTVIDPTKVPDGTRFFLDLECSPEHYEDLVELLAENRMIRQIYGVSGECRIHAAGFTKDSRTLENFANAIYRGQCGVRRLSCRTVLSTMMDRDGGVDYVRYQKSEHLEEKRKS